MTRFAPLQHPGPLIVGLDEALPYPLQTGIAGTRDFGGLEIDLCRRLAERLGVELEFVTFPWTRIIDQLLGGAVDVVCSAATITADRARQVRFSDPYLSFALGWVTSADDPVLGGDDLGKRSVGVRKNTVAESYVRSHLRAPEVRCYDQNQPAYDGLRTRQIELVIDDEPIARWYAGNTPGLRFGGVIPDTRMSYGLMFSPANPELQHAVNAVLRDLRTSGILDQLRRATFPPPIARLWRGSVPAAKAAAYLGYLHETGLEDYRRTPGNEAVWVLSRTEGDTTEFLIVSLWESLAAIRGFAGDDVEKARYYPEDAEYLLSFEPTVRHYEVWTELSD